MESLDEGFVLTRDGYDRMQRELEEIIAVKKPAVIDRIREARQLGDLSENFDYEDAKRAHAMIHARISELKAILMHATVVDPVANGGSVGIGSKVLVKYFEDDIEEEFIIVGPAESSPADGKISHECSVGSELMGKKTGDQISVETPSGLMKLQILSVI